MFYFPAKFLYKVFLLYKTISFTLINKISNLTLLQCSTNIIHLFLNCTTVYNPTCTISLLERNPSTVCSRFHCIFAHFLVFINDTKEEHIIWKPHPSIPCISNHQFWHTQVLFTSCQASVSLKQTPWHVLLRGVYKFLPVHSTILDQYGWNSVQTSILYWRAYMKFYLHLLHFYQMWINFSTKMSTKNDCFTKINPLNAILHVVT